MTAISNISVMGIRKETDSLGEVEVPSDSCGEREPSARSNTSTSVKI